MTKSKSPPSLEDRLGCKGILLCFLCWGLYGFFLGMGLVLYLSKAWQDVLGTLPERYPPGIVIAGSLGGYIAVFLCACGGAAVSSYRARRWGRKPAFIAGILGPLLGCLGCIAGSYAGGPNGWFVGALIGMVLGVHFGSKVGLREKK